MNGVISRPLLPLGLTAAVEDFTLDGFAWDYAIDGLPFLSATNDERKYQRGFVEQSKQQIDTSDEPGEQSLDNGVWLRSQSDFTAGAGRVFFESRDDALARKRFYRSEGVSPWGERLELLDSTSVAVAAGAGTSRCVTRTGSVAFLDPAGAVSEVDAAGAVTTVTGWSAPPTWIESVGTEMVGCHSLGIDITSGGGTVPLWTQTPGTAPRAWWVKQRLIAAVGPELHELTLAGGNLDTDSPLYTHPDSGWTWTACVETPDAILVAGYSGPVSVVYKLVLETDGGLPSLSAATTTAELPRGEIVHSLLCYLGSYVAFGTSRGVRIGTVGAGGAVSYGPLSWESDSPVRGLLGDDAYIYATRNGGLVRLSLAQIDDSGRAAYANDLASAPGATCAVAALGSSQRLAFAVDGVGLVVQGTTKVASGWLETSQVRFSTLQPKHFLYAYVRTPRLDGALTISTLEPDGDSSSIYTIPQGQAVDDAIGLARHSDTGEVSLGLRFDLARGSDPDKGAQLDGWEFQVLPAAARNERIQVWLQCFDSERDRMGNPNRGDGRAFMRFRALRDSARSGQQVRFQDFSTGEVLVCTVEDVQFVSSTPPGRDSGSRFGGFLGLQLRTV